MKFLGFLFIGYLSINLSLAQGVLSTKNKKAIEAYVEADNYRVRRQFKPAIELLTEAIGRDKNFFEAYLRMGYVYKDMNDFNKAKEYFENGLRITPEMRWQKVFWVELSDVGMKTGDYRLVAGYTQQYLQNETINKQRIAQMSLWQACAQFSM